MNILVVEPGKRAYEQQIDGSLESMQGIVGGLIEAVYPFDEPVALVCNDEGLINGMELNRLVNEDLGIFGPFFVCGLGDENFTSLPPDLMEKYKAEFLLPHSFIKLNNRIVAVPYEPLEQPEPPETDKPAPDMERD